MPNNENPCPNPSRKPGVLLVLPKQSLILDVKQLIEISRLCKDEAAGCSTSGLLLPLPPETGERHKVKAEIFLQYRTIRTKPIQISLVFDPIPETNNHTICSN